MYNSQGQQPVAGVQVRLFGAAQGAGGVRYQLQTDANGNVYTSENITFGNGLFPAVISASGDTAFMTEAISDGACNRCHGQSTERVKLP